MVGDGWKDDDRMTEWKGVRWSMNGGVISALAAIHGCFRRRSCVLANTWVGERSRHRRELLQWEIARRETAYSEFIERASKIYVASATHRIDDDDAEVEGVVSLYAVSEPHSAFLLLIKSLWKQRRSWIE
jgi:hypothetical protein